MKKKNGKPGPTGKYPQGKMNKQDEGELQIKIGTSDGKVIIEFGTEIKWLGFGPKEAADFAMMLIKNARNAAKVTGDIIEITL